MIGRPRALKGDREFLDSLRDLLCAADLQAITMATVSAHFGVCSNTMGATLKDLGTSWLKELRDERRRRFREATASGEAKSAPHYMEPLGFADPISFYRWFQRNYGTSFKDWRAKQMGAANEK